MTKTKIETDGKRFYPMHFKEGPFWPLWGGSWEHFKELSYDLYPPYGQHYDTVHFATEEEALQYIQENV